MPLIDTKYRYSVDQDSTFDQSYKLRAYDWENVSFDLDDEYDLESLAERCAEDFHGEHDGWERNSWSGGEPLVIKVWKDENTSVSFDVYLEYTPTYSATRS